MTQLVCRGVGAVKLCLEGLPLASYTNRAAAGKACAMPCAEVAYPVRRPAAIGCCQAGS